MSKEETEKVFQSDWLKLKQTTGKRRKQVEDDEQLIFSPESEKLTEEKNADYPASVGQCQKSSNAV